MLGQTRRIKITKKLEELFDLAQQDTLSKSDDGELPLVSIDTKSKLVEINSIIDKIEAALPMVKDLDAGDSEMDELAKKAIESYENLMDLGMNVDSRFASEIFSVASNMLGHAITAKTAKVNKKLKMIDLQLKKARLDKEAGNEVMDQGQGYILDRNERLRELITNNKLKD